jgi:hypothetical protein
MSLDPNVKFTKTPDDEDHNIPKYAAAVGSLMYTAVRIWPDIAFAMQALSQFTYNLSPAYWTAIKHVFWYLNGTQSLGLIYQRGGEVKPLAYSDMDWGKN